MKALIFLALFMGQILTGNYRKVNPSLPTPVEGWAMNDGSGLTFADSCGTSNTQTVTGAAGVTWGSHAGLPGSTPSFGNTVFSSGVNATATNFTGTSPFSVAQWVNWPNNDVPSAFVSTINASTVGWELGLNASRQLEVFLLNTFPSNMILTHANSALTASTLHLIGFSYDGTRSSTSVKIYTDGAAVASTTSTANLTASIANGTPVSLGGRPGGSLYVQLGTVLAYTSIYNVALTAGQWSALFSAGPSVCGH